MARTRFSFFVEEELKEQAKVAAQQDGRTLANWIEQAMKEKLERKENMEKPRGKSPHG